MKGWVRRLARYAVPQWHALAVAGALLVAGVGLEALKPWPMKLLVDSVLQGKPLPEGATWITRLPGAGSQTGLVAWTAGATVCVFLLATAALLAQKYVMSGATTRMTYRLSCDVFDHAQHLSLRYHRSHQVGDLTRRTIDDCHCVKSLIASVALQVLTALLSLAVMFTVMYRLDSQLALVSMIVALPLVGLMVAFSGPMTNRTYRQYELEGELMALAEQTLSAVPVVQAFTREEHETARFRDLSERTVRAYLGATVSRLQFRVATGAVTVLGTAGIIVIGGNHVLSGRTTLGSLLVFLAYLASLYAPLETLTYVSSEFASAAAGARRVFAVLDEAAEVAESPLAEPLRNPRGHVVLDHVTYGYQQGTPVVEDVCIEARPGETVALVGRTGAGKSTIVSLVARLADPWTGRVTIDGVDMRSLELASLRASVAHVLQEPYLMPITVAENIAYGRPGAPRAKVKEAAIAAGAHDFIEALPDGYDTVLDERGATLSGGERQRIAIARALLKDAPILILDEPTAALDAETEAAVVDALRVLTAHRTTFVVAHRLSTLQSADRVVVIDAGRVVETGTPAEVLASGGIYAEMHAVQYATDEAELGRADDTCVAHGRS